MQLKEKIAKTKEIINKSAKRWDPERIAIAWTGGKDSTVLLHLIKNMYNKKIPFRIMFNDSTIEFSEVYQFIKKIEKEWGLEILWLKHLPEDLNAYRRAGNKDEKIEIMHIAKINVINHVIEQYNIEAFMSGIRWDEHEARAEELYFSSRSNHIRVHPILHFSLNDIWEYIEKFDVPYVSLYDRGYKSLGEAPFTQPVESETSSEREGREATKEKIMVKLRKLGYW